MKLAKWPTPTRKYICTLFSRSPVARVCGCLLATRKVTKIHHRNHQTTGPETDCDLLHARSHPYTARSETQYRSLRFDRRRQNRIDKSHQRAEMGSAVGFHSRKVTARFPSPIHIWIVRPTTFAIKRRIIAESRSNKSILNFWGAIMFHTISVIFSSR